MSLIVLLPGLLAAYYLATNQSVHWAFLNIYIPVLLWFPSYYEWNAPIIPNPGFAEAVVVPIMLFFIARGMPGWQFSLIDILVFSFTFIISYSEYLAYGYKLAQNLMSSMVLSVLFPYILAKSLIVPAGLGAELAKRIVATLGAICWFLPYEMLARSNYTLWQRVLGRFFGKGWGRDIQYRWGLVRANGPFVHPIQAGIIMVMGFCLQRWLQWNQAWPAKLKQFPNLPLSVTQMVTLLLLFGVFAPLSRAPWLGLILATLAIFALAGIIKLAKKTVVRYLIIATILGSVVISGIALNQVMIQFASVGSEEASESSRERQTIAYRFELFTNYGETVMAKWQWGWGRLGWPQDQHQKSVDNAYLLLALNHGLLAVGCLWLLFLYTTIRLFIHAMRQPTSLLPQQELSLTLLAIMLMEIFCLSTVSLNTTNQTLLFILFAWSDAYVRSTPVTLTTAEKTETSHHSLPFKFTRTM